MEDVIKFLRANPQVFLLVVISLVLGIGTFLAVIISLITAPTDQTTGDPSGAILAVQTASHAVASALSLARGA